MFTVYGVKMFNLTQGTRTCPESFKPQHLQKLYGDCLCVVFVCVLLNNSKTMEQKQFECRITSHTIGPVAKLGCTQLIVYTSVRKLNRIYTFSYKRGKVNRNFH